MSKKMVYKLVYSIFSIVFVLSGFQLCVYMEDYFHGKNLYASAKNEFAILQVEEEKTIIEVDFAHLKIVNPDIVGWIYIPNTEINYPLLNGVDNRKYLKTAYNGETSSLGSIFVEMYNAQDMSDQHTIIYGHNNKSKEMFGTLSEYANQNYFDAHPIIYIVTPDEILQYEVFSAYKTHSYDLLYRVDFKTDEKYGEFLQSITKASKVTSESTPSGDDKILTLSTCTNRTITERFVVHARQIIK